MRTIELFAGCGGLAKGMELAGLKHEGFFEFNHQACESLRVNFNPNIVYEGDVRKIDFRTFEGVDVVSGGPPCQPFSLGGLAKAYDDTRDMFPQAARVISEVKPRAFVFENVKGLLREKFSEYFNYIILRLTYPECQLKDGEEWNNHHSRLNDISDGRVKYKGLRYNVSYKLLNAVDYGVPQVRERVFIVGFRSDLSIDWSWPERICKSAEDRVTIKEALAGIPDPKSKSNRYADHIFIGGAREYPGHTGSDINKPSKTVKAGAHGVPGGENMLKFPDGSIRYMTVCEAKLIQSFPVDFKVTGTWGEALRQIGNAVPVKLAKAVGDRIVEVLKKEERCEVLKRKETKVLTAAKDRHLKPPCVQLLLAVERQQAAMAKKQKEKGHKGMKLAVPIGRKKVSLKKALKKTKNG